jgi:hypothetical protein
MKETMEQKRERARILFEKATGVAPSRDWAGQTEQQLDILIWVFNGMIRNDPRVLKVLAEALGPNGARSAGPTPSV